MPLACVLIWKWPAFIVLLLYWLENWAHGFFTALRIACMRPQEASRWAKKLFQVPAFLIGFALFTALHGFFLFKLTEEAGAQTLPIGDWTAAQMRQYLRESGLWLPLTAIFASYLFSFVWDYLLHLEYRKADFGRLWDTGFLRIGVTQVAIIAGGLPVMLFGSPLPMVLLLVGLKVMLEVDPGLALRLWKRAAPST